MGATPIIAFRTVATVTAAAASAAAAPVVLSNSKSVEDRDVSTRASSLVHVDVTRIQEWMGKIIKGGKMCPRPIKNFQN